MDAIKWVLIVYLFNGTPTAEQVTLDVESARLCMTTCETLIRQKRYNDKSVVHCSCKRANEFYTNTASR